MSKIYYAGSSCHLHFAFKKITMVLPIVAYGAAILRKKSAPVRGTTALQELIRNLWDTLDHAGGAGLAAPQVNADARIFVVDSASMFSSISGKQSTRYRDAPGIRQVFINPVITDYSADTCEDEEGCLSIPGLSANVRRAAEIKVTYYDENMERTVGTFYDHTARIIQHEYDHLEGKLYIDLLPALHRRMWAGKLSRIAKGQVSCTYPLRIVR